MPIMLSSICCERALGGAEADENRAVLRNVAVGDVAPEDLAERDPGRCGRREKPSGLGSSSALSLLRRPMICSCRSTGSASQATASCATAGAAGSTPPSHGLPGGTSATDAASTSVGFSVPSMKPVRSRSWWYGQPTISCASARDAGKAHGDRAREVEQQVVGGAGKPDHDVMLGGRQGVAVPADHRLVEAVDVGGHRVGRDAAHSSGRKPVTRLTPPIVVRGSRSRGNGPYGVRRVDPGCQVELEIGVRSGAQGKDAGLRERHRQTIGRYDFSAKTY